MRHSVSDAPPRDSARSARQRGNTPASRIASSAAAGLWVTRPGSLREVKKNELKHARFVILLFNFYSASGPEGRNGAPP